MYRLRGLRVDWTRRAVARRPASLLGRTLTTTRPCLLTQDWVGEKIAASRRQFDEQYGDGRGDDARGLLSAKTATATATKYDSMKQSSNRSSHLIPRYNANSKRPQHRNQRSLITPRTRKHLSNDRNMQRPLTKRPIGKIPLAERLEYHKPQVRAKAWLEYKEEMACRLQLCFIRHQYPACDWTLHKARFSVWKVKMKRIASPKAPESWPWLEDGKWLFELDSAASMRQAWNELDVEKREKTWAHVMLSTLHLAPDRAHIVLDATLDPLPPGYAIHDVLLRIAQTLDPESFCSSRERLTRGEEIMELLVKIIEGTPSRHVPYNQRTFGLFAKKLMPHHVAELYQMSLTTGYKLHHNTLLQFASTLADSPEHKEQAFEIMKKLGDDGADLNAARYSSVITTLLKVKVDNPSMAEKMTFSPQRSLGYFIEKGFAPNVINFTALLDALCQQGDIEEAIRLPLLLAENGVALDTKTYATVFRGAKRSLKTENVRRALDVAKAAKAPYVAVLNNALHTIFYFADMESREHGDKRPWVYPLLGRMLRIYGQKFELEPLQWLLPDSLPLMLSPENDEVTDDKFHGKKKTHWHFTDTIVPFVEELFSTASEDGARLEPTTKTLATMVRAYIRSLNKPYDLMSFYNFFKSRLEEECKEKNWAQELVEKEGSIVHDTLILAMCERRVLLRPALQVFGDMLKDALKRKSINEAKQSTQGTTGKKKRSKAAAAVAKEATTTDKLHHPDPNLFTFSILIHGLIIRGDKILTEQVLQVMREEGIEPNLVTWNTLAKGYAKMQNISRTVRTFQDLEAAGLKPDEYTYRAFARLRNQDRALKMMESIIDVNKKKMALEQSVW